MKKFFRSFIYAIRGMRISLKEQRNLKVQLFVAAVTIGAGFYFDIEPWEWTAILLTIGLVIGLEMINSAIESLVDLITPEWNPKAGKIKDIAAGAVLLVAIIAVVVGVIIFRKYLVV